MIANITQGSHLQPIVDYNEKKVKEGEAERLEIANVYNNNVNTGVFLISNLGYNSKRKDKFIHISLNFPVEDIVKIDNEKIKNIVKEYMSSLGFDSDHPYLVYKHNDTLHPHVHIVTSKILSNGKAINDSNIRLKSQKITRELEEKYNLLRVKSYKDNIKILDNKKDISNKSLRDQLNSHLKYALSVHKVRSFQELQKYLNDNNLDISRIQGIRSLKGEGVPYTGIIFNRVDEKFIQRQKGIKSSSLYLKPTEKNLEKIFLRNNKFHKAKRLEIKNQLDYSLDKYKSISIDELERKLMHKGIKFNYKLDNDGKLVGVSFTDLKTDYRYTGENIGKSYTAKNLDRLISSKTELYPDALTMLSYSKYKSKLDHLDTSQKLHTLLALGFNIKIENSNIYITDYKNNIGEGYVLLQNNILIDNEIINFYKNKIGINFNKLTAVQLLEFEYNRAKLINNTEAMEYALNEIEKHNNENDYYDKSNAQSYLNDLYNDVFVYQNIQENQDNSLADIDKKKKKGRSFKKY